MAGFGKEDFFDYVQGVFKADVLVLKDETESFNPWIKAEVQSGYAPDYAVKIFRGRGWRNLTMKVTKWLTEEANKEIGLGGPGGN